MAWVPKHYHASTIDKIQLALDQELLSYPAICYVEDGQYTVWITKDGVIDYVGGYNQITSVDYLNGKLCFLTGNTILYEADTTMTPETADEIISEITNELDLVSYAKTEDVITMLDGKIGDLGEAGSVVEYIDNLSYNSLSDTPITNLYGSLTSTVVVSDLDDGVYRISGQYQVGGSYQTIQMSTNDALFIVQTDETEDITYITQILGNTIKIYSIDSENNCTSDKYITESYINDKDFITSESVIEYVRTLIDEAIAESASEIISEQLDTVLDEKLDAKFEAIADEDIISIFK